MSSLRVAVVQAGSVVGETDEAVAATLRAIREAHDRGVEVLVLPEAFIGGYPKGSSFGTVVGSRSAEGREEFRVYFQSAIAVPGDETEQIATAVREAGMHAVVGAIERSGGTLYCDALFFGPSGLEGVHRKLMPTASERLIWGFGDGSTMPTVDRDEATLGAAICWENYMPLFRATMYAKGVNVWCAPTVDDRDVWQATVRHIAVEGRTFVLSAAQYVPRPDGDPLIGGGSVIVSPFGEVLAGPLRDREGLLVADIDLDDVARARLDLDVVGHYARPDVFRLTVDEAPQRAVRLA